jgi:hypothetical protein
MATALFITRNDLVKNSILNGNVDTDKFIQFIKIAQQMHIQNYLGTKLYDKISDDIVAGTLTGDYLDLVNEYIQPMLNTFRNGRLFAVCSLRGEKQRTLKTQIRK